MTTDTTHAYTILESSYGDPRLRDPKLPHWARYPERSTWDEYEVREYPDGSRVRFERECSRWGSSGMAGDWLPSGELRAARLRAELEQLRLNVALFLATEASPGNAPEPAFCDAPRPSPWPETWREYLEKATRNVPRLSAAVGAL